MLGNSIKQQVKHITCRKIFNSFKFCSSLSYNEVEFSIYELDVR